MWKPQRAQEFELSPGDRIGPFLLEHKLGEGAVGVVFRAKRDGDGEVVALKILKKQVATDPVFQKRFEHEARAAQEVEHPHLVPILAAGVDGDHRYVAARFVPGTTLAERLSEEGPLSVSFVIRVTAEVASGLDALHGKGIVHRDVKPSNILIDEDGRAAVTDFGSAKGAAYTALTALGQVLGTLDYMAPELIRGEVAQPTSDVYAMAACVFECLTGRTPFGHKSVLQVGRAHLEEEPPDPSTIRPELPAGLSWTVLQGLQKDPSKRPPTAPAFANMLKLAATEPPRPAE